MKLNIPNGMTLPAEWDTMSREQKRAWSKKARKVHAADQRFIHEGRVTREAVDMLEGGDGFGDGEDYEEDPGEHPIVET